MLKWIRHFQDLLPFPRLEIPRKQEKIAMKSPSPVETKGGLHCLTPLEVIKEVKQLLR